MALGPQVAPQAYTRDTLSQAYAWLQTQPESIRKMASTPDFLVGLFLRYRRHGDPNAQTGDSPVSTQSFKSDLRNLAEDLKQFEDPNQQPPGPPEAPPPQAPPPRAAPQWSPPPPQPVYVQPHYTPPPVYTPPPEPVRPPQLDDLLDARSLKTVQDMRALLNLGTDIEACRALIAMGYERMRVLMGHQR